MKVVLITNHTQDGKQYTPGDEVDMSVEDATWYRTAIMNERVAQTALTETPLGQAALLVLGGKDK